MARFSSDTHRNDVAAAGPRQESYRHLFWRFLRFGLLAWGGPVAQIAMLRQELVEEEAWVSRERFNRALAVYQVLPGPEATELCIYFGLIARGRMGGLLAGLGFVLPGFVLMLLLSWFYVNFGMDSAIFAAMFYGFQPGVAALIVRAIHRIGQHALTDRWLWAIMLLAAGAELAGVPFIITLSAAGLIYAFVRRSPLVPVLLLCGAVLLGALLLMVVNSANPNAAAAVAGQPSLIQLFSSGVRSGLLTFGGAYTVIPYLQQDAVVAGGWMSNPQFLDGLALSGILPAPLIIFATFVGYLGSGLLGAIVLTIGIFLPAFMITLIGHNYLEQLVEQPAIGTFLAGVTAGVVGLISVAAFDLLRTAVTDFSTALIFTLALSLLYRWKAKIAVIAVIAAAGILGLLLAPWIGIINF